MGLDIARINSAYTNNSMIDKAAFARVSERIFNPEKTESVDISKLDLSKFNRVKLGTDLYAERTNAEVALKASKAATDFGVNFSKQFNANIQYLNSIAAQSLLSAQEIGGVKAAQISGDLLNQTLNEKEIIVSATQTTETKDLNKDKRGSNPFSFYFKAEGSETEDNDALNDINIFA